MDLYMEQRIRELEREGLCTSDAQAAAEAEMEKKPGRVELSAIRSHVESRGFNWADCPYTPIRPEWESFPIVQVIREAEKSTGTTYDRPAP